MKSPFVETMCAALVCLGLSEAVHAIDYSFTNIVGKTSGAFTVPGLGGFNNAGTVVFDGRLHGVPGIFTGSGGPVTTVYETNGSFSSFFAATINDSGSVAFNASLDAGGEGIFTGNGGLVTTIADTGDGLSFFSAPSINNSGTVAFSAFDSAGGAIFYR